jgi:hypothetical protein
VSLTPVVKLYRRVAKSKTLASVLSKNSGLVTRWELLPAAPLSEGSD